MTSGRPGHDDDDHRLAGRLEVVDQLGLRER
jgi:hypothetical protein